MTDREKLIEEAAEAIFLERWGETYLYENSSDTSVYISQARAALAVFEKAHTPTDDEREALATALHQGQPSCVGLDGYGLSKEDALVLAAVALDAGFRRSDQEKQ